MDLKANGVAFAGAFAGAWGVTKAITPALTDEKGKIGFMGGIVGATAVSFGMLAGGTLALSGRNFLKAGGFKTMKANGAVNTIKSTLKASHDEVLNMGWMG